MFERTCLARLVVSSVFGFYIVRFVSPLYYASCADHSLADRYSCLSQRYVESIAFSEKVSGRQQFSSARPDQALVRTERGSVDLSSINSFTFPITALCRELWSWFPVLFVECACQSAGARPGHKRRRPHMKTTTTVLTRVLRNILAVAEIPP